MKDAPSRLCVALDARERAEIERLADLVAPHAGMLKIGLTAFVAHGPALITAIKERRDVFLDLKLHDIPAQVEGASAAAADLGASFVTVHAAGGQSMIKAAVAAAGDTKVLAVTVLTSLDEADLDRIGIAGPSGDAVLRLASLAVDAGAAGIVCSPREVARLRGALGPEPVLVVPGIRPSGAAPDDQRRVLTPAEAAAAGADVLVVGRPITSAADPAEAAQSIAAEVSS